MTKKFFCILFFRDRNELDVSQNGIQSYNILQDMDYHGFGKSLIPKIIDTLIYNNRKNE